MPAPADKPSRYPGTIHTLGEAARQNQLIVLKCNLCRRSATYLASDLAKVLAPENDALLPPFACSRCGTTQYMRVSVRPPEAGDWGNLVVRRPGPIIRTQTWRSVRLGD